MRRKTSPALYLRAARPVAELRGVEVSGVDDVPAKIGTGIFAKILMDKFPALPVEEEANLHDPGAMEKFFKPTFPIPITGLPY